MDTASIVNRPVVFLMDAEATTVEDQVLCYRRLFGRFPTGVAVVLADDRGEIAGLTVNSLTSASLDPLLLVFCVRNESRSGAAILSTGRFTVNVLAAHQQAAARHFAGRKDRAVDAEFFREDGFIWLADSNAVFRCELEACYPGGDHRIIVGRVIGMVGPESCGHMLVYHEGWYARLEPRPINKSILEAEPS